MTREEAIEVYNGLINTKIKEAFEFFAPELRESEDERIRKWLVNYFTEIDENWIHREFTCKQIVAYLEKQKEQPKEELVYRLNGFMQEYIKEGKDVAEKEHRFKCYQLFWDALEDENFFEQKEQKPDDDPLDDPKFIKGFDTGREVQRIFDEQKPAEWSEEDELNIGWLIAYLKGEDAGEYYDEMMRESLASWLESLRPSWKPSEEQMEVLQTAERLVRANNYPENAKILAELYEQLKAL